MLFRQDQRQATAALLKEAVEWNKSSGIEGAGMATVWRKTAEFHLKTGEAKVAAESLEELQRLEPSLTTLAQLVTAYAKCDLGWFLFGKTKIGIITNQNQEKPSLLPRNCRHSSLHRILMSTVSRFQNKIF